MLAGCGGSQSPLGAPGIPEQSRASSARNEELVYVASEQGCNHIAPCQGTVSVLTYPQGRNVGQWFGGDGTYTEGACNPRGAERLSEWLAFDVNYGGPPRFTGYSSDHWMRS